MVANDQNDLSILHKRLSEETQNKVKLLSKFPPEYVEIPKEVANTQVAQVTNNNSLLKPTKNNSEEADNHTETRYHINRPKIDEAYFYGLPSPVKAQILNVVMQRGVTYKEFHALPEELKLMILLDQAKAKHTPPHDAGIQAADEGKRHSQTNQNQENNRIHTEITQGNPVSQQSHTTNGIPISDRMRDAPSL